MYLYHVKYYTIFNIPPGLVLSRVAGCAACRPYRYMVRAFLRFIDLRHVVYQYSQSRTWKYLTLPGIHLAPRQKE